MSLIPDPLHRIRSYLQNSQAWQAILAEVELFSFDVAWGCGATRFVQHLGAAAKKIQIFRHAATVAIPLSSSFRLRYGQLRDESQDLIGGQRNDTEHQMAHHLGVASHPNHAPAKLVLQAPVHPLHGGAFPIAHVLGVGEVQ